ncbi:MAG: aminotransferase class I/II-fold pyridoxal phosphate-dependent enzyme [Gammaproteobacteria bacterium]|nr:aminotransferase class I/II-fold pyridoxal phosphate-dependent enzyme [Gammaproteobacteria bacterium]
MNTRNSGSQPAVIDGAAAKAFSFYYNASQLRFDTWHRVKRMTERLSERNLKAAERSKLVDATREALALLQAIEDYTAFPSKDDFKYLWRLFERDEHVTLARVVGYLVRALVSHSYRSRSIDLTQTIEKGELDEDHDFGVETHEREGVAGRPYFELLIVDELSLQEESTICNGFRSVRRPEDKFIYDSVVVPSFEDALIAVLLNYNIQAVLIRYGFPFKSRHQIEILRRYLAGIDEEMVEHHSDTERSILLGSVIKDLRPELDLYLVTDIAVEAAAVGSTEHFKRIFYREFDFLEQHLSILRSLNERYQTPFFSALCEYSRQPTGVFHAMPISRGKSVTKSHWIQDMARFYGVNIFLAETSATSGGLDSLLQPSGPLKKAQELASRAFGSRQTYWVTNGTSTCNKIVVQALVQPGDIVLVDRDCHKSHHYGMVLAGARVCYLDSYPLHEFSMYGAVPLREIKHALLQYKRAGELDRVKMLLLTNCTFDGIVYNVERVMEECLAIKPDLVFLWDEAWFAFAGFTPTYRKRTAMHTARMLRRRYASAEYREAYSRYLEEMAGRDDGDDATWLDHRLMPDPDKVRVRVYATHSTHKTLTSLRQGSMIHVYDQDFRQKVEEPFHEAYMTHTSTSPNYQILASLDVGRRQVELEGFELVQKQIELAMSLREQVASNELLQRHFRFLVASDLVPDKYRPSGIQKYYDPEKGWHAMEEAWSTDDFVVDPTRLTLYLGKTGIDGDTFKNRYLMDKYGIQINKTSRNTVLFMTNIGTTRSSVAYLIGVLVKIARELEWTSEDMSQVERRIHEKKIHSLTVELPPLPDFSRFHAAFSPGLDAGTRDGDLRSAFFLSYDDSNCEYLRMEDGSIDEQMAAGREVVSSSFVIPYPPGFPILVPGQVVSGEILEFMRMLDVKEIHGYRPELGLRVFTEDALASLTPATVENKKARKAGGHS